jgi:hypothetical protein
MDGCGPELKAVTDICSGKLDEGLETILPQNNNIAKLINAGTALYQPQDVGKGHKKFRSIAKSDKHCLLEGVDDDRIPTYAGLVFNLLMKHRFKLSAVRTYYKYFINYENWLDLSFTARVVRSSFKVSAQWPWNQVAYMNRWSGHRSLTEKDHKIISSHLPMLVQIASTCGGIHRALIIQLMGNFIDQLNNKGISSQARENLYLSELQKPIADRDFGQYPMWILTNKGFLDLVRHREEQALKAHIDSQNKKSDLDEKKKLKDDLDDIELKGFYNYCKGEFVNGKFIDDANWNKTKYPFKASVYKLAWNVYCKPTVNHTIPTTIAGKCNDLETALTNLLIQEEKIIHT